MSRYINPYTDFGFKKLFGEELASLTTEQRAAYEENLIQYWGMKSAIETAAETAAEERTFKIALNAILEGASDDFIAKITSLSLEEVKKLRAELKNKNQ